MAVTRTLRGTETPRSEAWASGAGVVLHLVFLPSRGAATFAMRSNSSTRVSVLFTTVRA